MAASRTASPDRSIVINYEGMRHAPENELGVVFLFSKVAKRLGFIGIDVIQPHFPDCLALRRAGRGVQHVWVEFEYRSQGFRSHVRQLRGLRPRHGVVVCWEHNWPECEKYAEVIDLRVVIGVGRQVWILPTSPEEQRHFDEIPRRGGSDSWSVAARTRPGDLALMYRAGTKSEARKWNVDPNLLQSITHVFRVGSSPERDRKRKWSADVRLLARLPNPLRLERMRHDRVLKSSFFVMRGMVGRSGATAYWYRLYDLILEAHPGAEVRKVLAPYRPELL